MNKLLLSLTVAASLLLGGCIAPKPIEFGQDKVEKFPVAKQVEREIQRQAAQRAAVKAEETLNAAIATAAEPDVIKPAAETSVLAESVSTSLGPPLKPAAADKTSEQVARDLDNATAKLNRRIDNFREGNDENAGKKIEGTGIFSLGYGSYLLIMVGLGILAYLAFRIGSVVLKAMAVSNPGIGLGLNAVRAGGAIASKGFGQLVKGGEKFKEYIQTELKEVDAETKSRIEQLFVDAHKESADEDVRDVVKALIRK